MKTVMNKKVKKINENNLNEGISATKCVEKSIYILKKNFWSVIPVYNLGTVPFLIGIIYFINDMHLRSDAVQLLPMHSFILALLFLWKNIFQTLFCRKIMHILTSSNTEDEFSLKDFFRIILHQGILQPPLLLINFVAITIGVQPVVFAYNGAFMIKDSFERKSLKNSIVESSIHSMQFLKQNCIIYFFIFIFSVMVVLNAGVLFFLIPRLLKIFFGFDTPFSSYSSLEFLVNLIFNSTFWSIIFSIAYISSDPLIKTAYTIRYFYAESLKKGYDIKAELTSFKMKSLVIILFIAIIPNTIFSNETSSQNIKLEKSSQEILNKSEDLKKQINKVLEQREFAWRLPSEKDENKNNFISNFLKNIIKTADEWINAIYDVFYKIFPPDNDKNGNFLRTVFSFLNNLLIVIAAVLIVTTVLLYVLKYSKRKNGELLENIEIKKSEPDLSEEDISAEQFSLSEWLSIAYKMIKNKNYPYAVRAFYLATLSSLAEEHLITLSSDKTNHEYLNELHRRCHYNPHRIKIFSENLNIFEKVWYGSHSLSDDDFATFRENLNALIINEESE